MSSILLPGKSATYAFFQCFVLPAFFPILFDLPLMLAVFTLLTEPRMFESWGRSKIGSVKIFKTFLVSIVKVVFDSYIP